MAVNSIKSLISGVIDAAKTGPAAPVAIHDASLFDALAAEMAGFVAAQDDADILVLLDNQTAARVPGLEVLRDKATDIVMAGEAPQSWRASVKHTIPSNGAERFIIIQSESVSGAILSEALEQRGESNAFSAVWTCEPSDIAHCAGTVLSLAGIEPKPLAIPQTATGYNAALAMRLATMHIREHGAIDRTRPMEQDDLLAVLDILKAISSRRRSHDILYVFVEQIARVIHVDRCSVLRVWGNEEQAGHVLASHEDASVDDLIIDLTRYPEIARALNSGSKVVIEDVLSHPITQSFADELKKANIRSVLVVPIVLYDPAVGSLLLRAARSDGAFSQREVGFCEIVSEAASNALERAHLFDEIQKANQRLEHLATTDGLTSLHNHRYFSERMDAEFARALRYRLPLACLLIDIDDFKEINDTYGHLAGDEVLKSVADRINSVVRQSDVVARYGGEEFAVIMPQTGLDGAASKADMLRELVGDDAYDVLPEGIRVTVSVGVAVLERSEMNTHQQLLRCADEALYFAKRNGKNQVAIGPVQGDTM